MCVKPIPYVELEFYGGNGEKFLLAYFKFALENAVLGYIGAKAVDAVEALYHIAKARRAGKAALELLEEAEIGEGAVKTINGATSAFKKVDNVASAVSRSPAQKRAFLRQLAEDPRTPSWQKQWLREGRNPPGYDVDHITPLSIGGADNPSNMRLVLRADHRIHHKFYRPWEK